MVGLPDTPTTYAFPALSTTIALPPSYSSPLLWGAAALLLILVFVTGNFIRRFRWRHMLLFEKPVHVGLGVGGIVVNLLLSVVVLGLTAGLGLPWLYSRYRRSFYRNCTLEG